MDQLKSKNQEMADKNGEIKLMLSFFIVSDSQMYDLNQK
jgi:hypothetical protein